MIGDILTFKLVFRLAIDLRSKRAQSRCKSTQVREIVDKTKFKTCNDLHLRLAKDNENGTVVATDIGLTAKATLATKQSW